MNTNTKKFGLGRGLEALLGDEDLNLNLDEENTNVDTLMENTVFKTHKSNEIAISEIEPCKFQPRTEFNVEALQSLCDSIKEKGVLQPLLLRKKGVKYEI